MRILTLIIVGALVLNPGAVLRVSTTDKDPSGRSYQGKKDDKRGSLIVDAVGDSSANVSHGEVADEPRDRYFREGGLICEINDAGNAEYRIEYAVEACSDDATDVSSPVECAGETVQLDALWVSRVDAQGNFGAAELVTPGSCVTPGDVADEAARAFAELQVSAPVPNIQAREPLLVNVHYPVQANAEALEEQFTLLDVPVTIRAEPAEYRWDFDDPHKPGGGTVTTTDPGRLWSEGMAEPDESWLGYTYTHLGDPDTDTDTLIDAEGDWYRDDVTITLTTTWTGRFQLVGTSTWTDIDGTLTTTSSIDPLRVTEARVRLVCTDLNGNNTC